MNNKLFLNDIIIQSFVTGNNPNPFNVTNRDTYKTNTAATPCGGDGCTKGDCTSERDCSLTPDCVDVTVLETNVFGGCKTSDPVICGPTTDPLKCATVRGNTCNTCGGTCNPVICDVDVTVLNTNVFAECQNTSNLAKCGPTADPVKCATARGNTCNTCGSTCNPVVCDVDVTVLNTNMFAGCPDTSNPLICGPTTNPIKCATARGNTCNTCGGTCNPIVCDVDVTVLNTNVFAGCPDTSNPLTCGPTTNPVKCATIRGNTCSPTDCDITVLNTNVFAGCPDTTNPFNCGPTTDPVKCATARGNTCNTCGGTCNPVVCDVNVTVLNTNVFAGCRTSNPLICG